MMSERPSTAVTDINFKNANILLMLGLKIHIVGTVCLNASLERI
jgi:hypothetical protein